MFEKEVREEKDQEFIVRNTLRRPLYHVVGVFAEAQQCGFHCDFDQYAALSTAVNTLVM